MESDLTHLQGRPAKSERAKREESIVIHKNLRKGVKKWQEINEEIMGLELRKNGHDIVIIGVYVLTDDTDANTKDDFYENT